MYVFCCTSATIASAEHSTATCWLRQGTFWTPPRTLTQHFCLIRKTKIVTHIN